MVGFSLSHFFLENFLQIDTGQVMGMLSSCEDGTYQTCSKNDLETHAHPPDSPVVSMGIDTLPCIMYLVYQNSKAPVKLVGCQCSSKGPLVERMACPKLTRADSLNIYCFVSC